MTGPMDMPRPMDVPRPNLPLLRKVLDHIDAHPDEWNQENWGVTTSRSSCGTAFCIAGHAAVMAGATVRPSRNERHLRFFGPDGKEISPFHAGQEALGLTEDEADDLFEAYNDRAEVQRHAKQIAARAGERL